MTKETNGWEEEFDEKFCKGGCEHEKYLLAYVKPRTHCNYCGSPRRGKILGSYILDRLTEIRSWVKKTISQAILSAEERGREKANKKVRDFIDENSVNNYDWTIQNYVDFVNRIYSLSLPDQGIKEEKK